MEGGSAATIEMEFSLSFSPAFRVHSLFHSTSLSAVYSCLQSCFHTTDFKVCAKLKCNASCSAPRDYLAQHCKYILHFLRADGGTVVQQQQFKHKLLFPIFILYLKHTLEIYTRSLQCVIESPVVLTILKLVYVLTVVYFSEPNSGRSQ